VLRVLWRIPIPTYHRRMEEPSFLYLVSPLLVVVGILGLFSLSSASCSLPGQWQCLLRSRSLRSITCPVQTGFGSLWALLGSFGWRFSSTRSLIVREFGDAASPLPLRGGSTQLLPLEKAQAATDPARSVTVVTDTHPKLCENYSVGRGLMLELGRSR